YADPSRSHRPHPATLRRFPQGRRFVPMIHATRLEILRLLERASELDPDARFGQLVAFLPELVDGPADQRLGDRDDEALLQAWRHHVEAVSRRKQQVA